MIYPAIEVITERLKEIDGLNVIKGSLRSHKVAIPTPSAIIVPLEIKTERTGLQYCVVSERYEIVLLVSDNRPNPYLELTKLAVKVANAFSFWLPDAWNEKVTVKNVEVSSVRFDTHLEAGELGLIAGSVEIEVTYYAV